MRGIYVVNLTAVTSPANTNPYTLIQVKAGTASGLEIIRASVTQSGSTTSTMQRIQLLRKSAAATVTSFTPLLMSPNDAAAQAAGSTSATGTNASAEGTNGDILVNEAFNIVSGWLYLPVPEERIQVVPGGILGLTMPANISAAVWTAQIIFREFN